VWPLQRHRQFLGSLLLRSKRGAENSNNNFALFFRMGTACSRVRRASRASQTEEESEDTASQDWELIAPAVPVVVDQPSTSRSRFVVQGNLVLPTTVTPARSQPVATPARERFRRAIKKVKNLLALRILWSRLGGWLNVSSFRHHPSRRSVAWTFAYLGKIVRPVAPLFNHLVRRRGRLQYDRRFATPAWDAYGAAVGALADSVLLA
jgi:hypothetical protein